MKRKFFFSFIYNFIVVILLFFLLEAGTRIFYPEIKLPGTQQSLLENSVFYDSQGYKPKSFGLSSDVFKRVDESGFLQYSSGQAGSCRFN
ncbi:MAG: hypothetical protein IPJ03_12905 [Ignavibacteriales bacterium]|nr:hypothetical protein [Ignavibacteriales bacterium]